MGMEYRETNNSRRDGKSGQISCDFCSKTPHLLRLLEYMCNRSTDDPEDTNSWCNSGNVLNWECMASEDILLSANRMLSRAAFDDCWSNSN